jgi:sulfur-carrier protein adenylyltransferase/sulfurtransferase
VLAASAHELDCAVEPGSRIGAEKALVATLRFSAAACQPHPLYSAIWRRCTNRRMFRRSALLPAARTALQQAQEGTNGADMRFITDRGELRKLAEIVTAADCVRVGRRDLHEHLMSALRFSPQAALETRDGLPLNNLEAGLAGELFMRLTRRWAVMNALNKVGVGRIAAAAAARGLNYCSAALLISVAGCSPADYVSGGRALQRVWLTCSKLGLHFQPMTALTLFALRWQLEGGGSFSGAHRELLEELWPRYAQLWGLPSGTEPGQIMLARIGSGEAPSVRTLRRPVERFIAA